MKILKNDFSRFNFSDHYIKSMILDRKEKKLEIRVDGVYYKSNNSWEELGENILRIFNWNSVKVSMYVVKSSSWVDLNDNDIDFLKEICETEINDDVIIRGFGKKTGQWIEYKINKPTIEIDVLNKN